MSTGSNNQFTKQITNQATNTNKITSFTSTIHTKAIKIAKQYKRCEIELIDILEQIDQHKVFYKYGYSSTFKYATDELGLSTEVACIFINVARKTREVPALKAEIKRGNISVSKARRITPVLNSNNQKQWLELAKTTSKRKLEKQVAEVAPQTAVKDRLSYVHPDKEIKDNAKIMRLEALNLEKGLKQRAARVQLQAGVSEQLMLKLRRVQDLVSQKSRNNASLENALEAMADLYIQRHDPVEKAKRQKIKGKLSGENFESRTSGTSVEELTTEHIKESKAKSSCPGTVNNAKMNGRRERSNSCGQRKGKSISGAMEGGDKQPVSKKSGPKTTLHQRKPLSAQLKHQVMLRDEGRCTFKHPNGKRCEQRRYLEIHHLIPVSRGGDDELSNLTLLCSGHHKSIHISEWF